MKMNIPKFFHPILGVLVGAILFLVAIAILSAVFVLTYNMVLYAKPFVMDFFSYMIHRLITLMPL